MNKQEVVACWEQIVTDDQEKLAKTSPDKAERLALRRENLRLDTLILERVRGMADEDAAQHGERLTSNVPTHRGAAFLMLGWTDLTV